MAWYGRQFQHPRAMANFQYPCPKCSAILQSARDVAGLPVKCLGCQAVFTAQQGKSGATTVPPLPKPPEPKPAAVKAPRPKPARPERPASTPDLPPLPDSMRSGRRVGVVVMGVLGVAFLAAAGITVAVVRSQKQKTDPAPVVAAQPKRDPTPMPAKEVTPKQPVSKSEPRREEEEEEPVRPGPMSPSPQTPKLTPSSTPEPPSVDPKPTPPVAPSTPKVDPPATETGPAGDGQIPKAVLDSIKASTVFIKVRADRLSGSGSGFVLRVDGDTALIVTNDHVTTPRQKKELFNPAGLVRDVVFHSGRKTEFTLRGELLASDTRRDLAILRVRGISGQANFPRALNTSERVALSETLPVYIVGFPFGQQLAAGAQNPAVTISKGIISSLKEDDNGELSAIQIDGDINPGNSGGPVVDARGRLVGICVAKVSNTQIGFAIPTNDLDRMLDGRVGKFDVTRGNTTAQGIEVNVRTELVDPFDKIAAVKLYYARADAIRDRPRPGRDGKWEAISRDHVDLRIERGSASGTLRLLEADLGQVPLVLQAAITTREGSTSILEPVIHFWGGRPDGPAGSPFGPGAPPKGPGGFGPRGGVPALPGGPMGPGNIPGPPGLVPPKPPLPPGRN